MTTPFQPRDELSVRATREHDWATVREVRLAALAESPAMFGSTLARERLFDEATWRARTVHTAVAWRDDAAVGIAGWHWTEPDVAADVVSMWVSPDARGTGAGAALVRWVVGEVVGERRCRLELGVVSGNLAALGLYRRLGFVAIGSEIGGHSGSLLIRMRYDSALDTAGASECR